jgi:uncharacterized protein (DUF433 family)
MTRTEIKQEYGVSEEDVAAALNYAAELIETETFRPLPTPAA